MAIESTSYLNPEPASGVDKRLLGKQIVAAGLPKPRGVAVSGGNVTVWFLLADALDGTEQTTLTSTVSAHDGADKSDAYSSVLGKISTAFVAKLSRSTFTYNSNTFPMDRESREAWLALYASRSAHTYSGATQPRMTDADGATVLIASATDVENHVDAMGLVYTAAVNAKILARVNVLAAADLDAALAEAATYIGS